MPEFNLTEDQIGALDKDGAIVAHPLQDINGNAYDRVNATRKYLTLGGKRCFIVIPTGQDKEDNVYKLAGAKSAPKSEG